MLYSYNGKVIDMPEEEKKEKPKKEAEEATERLTVTIDLPKSRYDRLKKLSDISGLPMGSLYKVEEKCPECIEKWIPLIEEFEKKKEKPKEVKK